MVTFKILDPQQQAARIDFLREKVINATDISYAERLLRAVWASDLPDDEFRRFVGMVLPDLLAEEGGAQ